MWSLLELTGAGARFRTVSQKMLYSSGDGFFFMVKLKEWGKGKTKARVGTVSQMVYCIREIETMLVVTLWSMSG